MEEIVTVPAGVESAAIVYPKELVAATTTAAAKEKLEDMTKDVPRQKMESAAAAATKDV